MIFHTRFSDAGRITFTFHFQGTKTLFNMFMYAFLYNKIDLGSSRKLRILRAHTCKHVIDHRSRDFVDLVWKIGTSSSRDLVLEIDYELFNCRCSTANIVGQHLYMFWQVCNSLCKQLYLHSVNTWCGKEQAFCLSLLNHLESGKKVKQRVKLVPETVTTIGLCACWVCDNYRGEKSHLITWISLSNALRDAYVTWLWPSVLTVQRSWFCCNVFIEQPEHCCGEINAQRPGP